MATPKKAPSSSELERDKADQEGERTSKDEDIELTSAFERTVDEGERRLSRTGPGLLATGMAGGVDISIGLFALYLVDQKTHNPLLSALAFGIGFIALTLASSELFTENFLVPIFAVYARRSKLRSLIRLWGGTAAANLTGGWIMTGIIVIAAPSLSATILEVARGYSNLGLGAKSFALAVLGGMVITLMTWMERSTTSVPSKIIAAVCAAFLLAAGSLNHAIVVSLIMFAALHIGAPFGYLDWLGMLVWASLGNMVGGVGLVTILRLVEVGRRKLEDEKKA